MADYPELIDDERTIRIRIGSGFPGLPFSIRDNGASPEIAAAALFFEIPSIDFRRALAAHPGDARKRMLPKMTRTECEAIPAAGVAYVVWDETDANHRVDLFGGRIERYP